jgi:hypothetical protein
LTTGGRPGSVGHHICQPTHSLVPGSPISRLSVCCKAYLGHTTSYRKQTSSIGGGLGHHSQEGVPPMSTQVLRTAIPTVLLTATIPLALTTLVSIKAPVANADQASFQQCLKADNVGTIYDPNFTNCCVQEGGTPTYGAPPYANFPGCSFPFVPERTAPEIPGPPPPSRSTPPTSGMKPTPR